MLLLRRLRAEDEAAVEAAHAQMAEEGFPFLLHRDCVASFGEYVELLEPSLSGLSETPGSLEFLARARGEAD